MLFHLVLILSVISHNARPRSPSSKPLPPPPAEPSVHPIRAPRYERAETAIVVALLFFLFCCFLHCFVMFRFFPQHFIYFVSLLPQFLFQLCFISYIRKFSVSRLKIQNPSVLSYQEVFLRGPMLLLQEGREAEIESAAERRLCFTVKKLRQMEEVKKQHLDDETNKDDKMVS